MPILPLNAAKTAGRAENSTLALALGSYLHTKLVLALLCGSQPEIHADRRLRGWRVAKCMRVIRITCAVANPGYVVVYTHAHSIVKRHKCCAKP